LKQQAAGAELAHLSPPHINPSPEIIEFLSATAGKVRVTEAETVAV
jgi:hypothetical protein